MTTVDRSLTLTGTGSATEPPEKPKRNFGARIGMNRFSGLYVIALLMIVFSIWLPQTFPTFLTFRSIFDQHSVPAILAIALIIPIAAGVFDLSIAGMLAVSVVVTASMVSQGVNPAIAVVLALVIGVGVGVVNGFVVVRLHVNSFIATLGMSSILAGIAFWITGGQPIVKNIDAAFLQMGRISLLGAPIALLYLIVIALVVWYVMSRTPAGRYLYATGGNEQAARLAGVRTNKVMFLSLVASALLASLAGVILMAKVGVGNYDVGASYLLPAFSAAFLGSTQIRPGRMNVLGTLVAVFLLAVGVKGLQLAGVPPFVENLFNGLALIIAVALAARSHLNRKN
jgi:ribose transport system permease protein